LHKDIVVWVAVKNLLKECDIMKQMILNKELPTYVELEMRLRVLSEEMSRKVQENEVENEALFSYNTLSRRPSNGGTPSNPRTRNGGSSFHQGGSPPQYTTDCHSREDLIWDDQESLTPTTGKAAPILTTREKASTAVATDRGESDLMSDLRTNQRR
jgi:hypothetical protein